MYLYLFSTTTYCIRTWKYYLSLWVNGYLKVKLDKTHLIYTSKYLLAMWSLKSNLEHRIESVILNLYFCKIVKDQNFFWIIIKMIYGRKCKLQKAMRKIKTPKLLTHTLNSRVNPGLPKIEGYESEVGALPSHGMHHLWVFLSRSPVSFIKQMWVLLSRHSGQD